MEEKRKSRRVSFLPALPRQQPLAESISTEQEEQAGKEDKQAKRRSQQLQNRTSVRYSTYSTAAPSFAPSTRTTDSATAEIRDIEKGLDRMENKALSSQRVALSEEKSANLSKLALGAKLERALDRRMVGQDAEMRKRPRPAVFVVGGGEKEKA
jgi:hypothetical protein